MVVQVMVLNYKWCQMGEIGSGAAPNSCFLRIQSQFTNNLTQIYYISEEKNESLSLKGTLDSWS